MSSCKDLFIDVNTFDTDDINYIKPISFYKVTKNIGIYHQKSSDKKKQKIIVKSPKMIVPFGVKEFNNNGYKSYKMSMSFSTLTNLYNEDEIKKFFFFIKKIDSVNEETVMDHKKKWGLPKNIKYKKILQRSSNDFPHLMGTNLPYDEKQGFLFNVYDENAEKASIDIIEKRSIVSVIMEITDLIFTEKTFWTNITILQIRKCKTYSPIQDFFMSGCFICDEDDPEDTAYLKLIEKYQQKLKTPLSLPNIPQMNPYFSQQMNPYSDHQMCPPPPPPKKPEPSKPVVTFQPPTLAELLNTKSSLKKTETVVKSLFPDNKNNVVKEKDIEPELETEPEIEPEPPKKKKKKKNNKKLAHA